LGGQVLLTRESATPTFYARFRGACFERRIISSLLIGGVASARRSKSSRRLSLSRSEGVGMGSNSDTGAMYASFMEEIKWRLDEVMRRLQLAKGKERERSTIFEIELCFLQMRFVCELIALASLAAHHSYGLKGDLLKEWHADQIFAELEEINEHCFPWPVRVTRDANGYMHIADKPDCAMARSDLKDIYGKCGRALHRGVLKHTLAGSDKTYDVNELIDWLRAISALLAEHSILFPHGNRAMLVSLFGGPNGAVAVLQLSADGPFSAQRAAHRQRPSPVTGKPRHPRRRR
jgi:hypothetical protein